MGGATRFMTLLTTPFPPLRPSLLILRRRLSTLPSVTIHPINISSHSRIHYRTSQLVNCFHSQHNSNSYPLQSSSAAHPQQNQHHPWSEWTHFLSILPNSQGLQEPQILPEDAFVVYEQLPDDFVRAAASCLDFARTRPNLLGLLSRRDIEAVVSNGTPFLFKSALDTARRMRAFLGSDGNNVSELDKATTVDLMKYILSYASNPSVSPERNGLYSRELVDSSVRNLLHDLVTVSGGAPVAPMPASDQQFPPGIMGQSPRPIGHNVEMKRGDWICPKCNFMNFARNMKCLECEGPRPKRQLTGGEWECPQCTFFNYGRNTICLRCDCKRPGASVFNTVDPGSSFFNGDYPNKTNMDTSRPDPNEGRAQRLFDKVSQMNVSNDIKNASHYKGSPETMPLRQGDNTFSLNESKTPLDVRLSNSQRQINLNDNSNSYSSNSMPDASINRSPDRIGGKSPTISERNRLDFISEKNIGMKSSPSLSSSWFSESQYPQTEVRENLSLEDGNQITTSNVPQSAGDNIQFRKDPINSTDTEKEHTEKSDTWFERVSELHGVKGIPSAVSDDFPETMPMRKGENRFVVSKKKDRSLSSPKYKRQEAMDQANGSNFIPFVPFPPGYFARKDNEHMNTSDSPAKSSSGPAPTNAMAEIERVDDSRYRNPSPRNEDKPTAVSSSFPSNNMAIGPRINNQMGSAKPLSSVHSSNTFQENLQQTATGEPEIIRNSWTEKSLEGSAVKEPDPLDMSEEAKAERWFKRVAQIKDISELSQIPDEDFPSIMPMRKGVNRFVVSKRKTPLERRLTSQKYRRNLPIVSNDNVKKENDNNS